MCILALRVLAKLKNKNKNKTRLLWKWWAGPGLNGETIWKIGPNVLVLIFWGSIKCVLFKVVSHYDLSVLSMSAMVSKKRLDRGWVGGVSYIQCFLNFFST